MKRLLRLLLPAIVLVPVIAIAPSASAGVPTTKTCSGEYDLTLSAPMGGPTAAPVSVSFTMTGGGCTGSTWASQLQGDLHGNCGTATGAGWFADGTFFRAVWAGRTLTVAGEGAGTFVVVTPADCEGATSFDVIGVVGPFVDICAGFGTMNLSTPFVFLPGPSRSATFSIALSVGACATTVLEGRQFFASGAITGNCGLAFGSGTSSDGEPFEISWLNPPVGNGGGQLVLTGNVVGEIRVVADVTSGDSCTDWGADNFIAQGEVAKTR